MLQQLKMMEQEGRWPDIRTAGATILQGLTGDDLARGYLGLSKAYEETATSPEDYRTALTYARLAVASAKQGGLIHVWALHRVAAYLADFGQFRAAEVAGREFAAELATQPAAKVVAPWVWFALGRAQHYQGRHTDALRWFDRALQDGAAGELAERVRLFTVWSLAESGRVREAFAALPDRLEHLSAGYIFAAMAAVHAAAGDWQSAGACARSALDDYKAGTWRVFDSLQLAEVCLILKQSAVRAGRFDQVEVWAVSAAAALAHWNEAVLSLLVPTLGPGGGETFEAVQVRGLPAGYRRCGLRGVVG